MADTKPKIAIPDWQRAKVELQDQVNAAASKDTAAKDASADADDTAPPTNDLSPTTAPTAEKLTTEGENETKASTSTTDTIAASSKQSEQTPQQTNPASSPPPASTSSLSARPVGPPIITYPEFLVQAHQPPPLITPTRVVNTLYSASAAATLFYGVSRFVVEPMIEALTSSRHELLTHSNSKIDEFNERLSKIVSKIPPPPNATKNTIPHDVVPPPVSDSASEVESITSDPTELFHRDMGTQTSPGATAAPSEISSVDDAEKTPPTSAEQVGTHTTTLSTLSKRMREVAEDNARVRKTQKEGYNTVSQLRGDLDSMIYTGVTLAGISTIDGPVGSKFGGGESDAIEQLKKEIRGVKGVLLSAKRFPAAGGRARPDLSFDSV